MNRESLKFKVGLSLVITLGLAALLFTSLAVKNSREQLMEQTVGHAAQLSEAIINSTRYAMLENRPSYVDHILADVGKQNDIQKVRILSKSGTIIHSSDVSEIGAEVDMEAESCLACHLDEKAREESPMIGRPRIFSDPDGQRLLGTTAVIENEPTCATSSCHVHRDDQNVLGVLDIVYPLEKFDQTIRSNTVKIIALALGLVVVLAFVVIFLLHRFVYHPLRDLKAGADRLAAGDLEHSIPVRSHDELGQLAMSFNSMTDALHHSRQELEEWGHKLERRVQEATRELQIAHAETARSEKLASVGLLAAGIAHELNNPLTGVLTFSHLVREQLPDDSPEAEDLDLVIRETKRCAAIIRRLLDFAREKKPEMKFADVNELIEDTIQLVEQAAQGEDVVIIKNLESSIPAIWIDEDLIRQVVMNILVNAQHAIDGEGTIRVQTRIVEDYQHPEPAFGTVPMVEISITDTGCGIPEENLQRVFDPFFTTKSVGKGTGLGLSVSHGTVRAHGGEIEVESTVGEGTQFRVYLPFGPPQSGKNRNKK